MHQVAISTAQFCVEGNLKFLLITSYDTCGQYKGGIPPLLLPCYPPSLSLIVERVQGHRSFLVDHVFKSS